MLNKKRGRFKGRRDTVTTTVLLDPALRLSLQVAVDLPVVLVPRVVQALQRLGTQRPVRWVTTRLRNVAVLGSNGDRVHAQEDAELRLEER
jgi:hypothetical protein